MSLLNTIKFIINHPLNKEDKLKAILRFIKWQIGSRLVPGEIVYEWVNGSKFLVKAGETGLTGNIYTGLHEFSDMAFLLHVLREKDLFIDVGANVGSYTILACAAIGASGYAFEPIPSTYKRLVENIHLNHLYEKVKCINKGIGNHQGMLAFTSDRDTTNHVLADGEQNTSAINVEVTSLDMALKGTLPNVMKIDVEGYETLVLEGAQNTLNKETLHSIIMELNGSGKQYGFDESRVFELMYGYGFKTYSYHPFTRSLLEIESKNLDSGNTLFIRDKGFVEERLQNSPKIFIHNKGF